MFHMVPADRRRGAARHPLPRAEARCAVAGSMAVLASVAALAAPAIGSAAPAHTARTPACRTTQLVVWLNNENGAAGTIYYTLNFTDLGAPCTLRGYPGVSAVGLRGNQLGRSARRSTTTKVRSVTLTAAGTSQGSRDTAHSTVGIVEAGNLPATSCRPTTAAGLRVYPPGQRSAARVPYPFPACSRSTASILSVAAVTSRG